MGKKFHDKYNDPFNKPIGGVITTGNARQRRKIRREYERFFLKAKAGWEEKAKNTNGSP